MKTSGGPILTQTAVGFRLSTNLVIYLTRIMGSRPAAAAMQVNLFEGTCYLTPLLGAWLADARWGRYKTILVFSAIYFLVSSDTMRILSSRCLAPPLSQTSHASHA